MQGGSTVERRKKTEAWSEQYCRRRKGEKSKPERREGKKHSELQAGGLSRLFINLAERLPLRALQHLLEVARRGGSTYRFRLHQLRPHRPPPARRDPSAHELTERKCPAAEGLHLGAISLPLLPKLLQLKLLVRMVRLPRHLPLRSVRAPPEAVRVVRRRRRVRGEGGGKAEGFSYGAEEGKHGGRGGGRRRGGGEGGMAVPLD